jgi:hypothetical protein
LAQLIRARSNFVTAAYSFEFVYHVVDFLTCHEAADALEVAVAASEEGHVLDDVVIIGSHVDKNRAGALGGVLEVFHFIL